LPIVKLCKAAKCTKLLAYKAAKHSREGNVKKKKKAHGTVKLT